MHVVSSIPLHANERPSDSLRITSSVRVLTIHIQDEASSSITSNTTRLTTAYGTAGPWEVILRTGYVLLYAPMATAYILWNLVTNRCTVWKTREQATFTTVRSFNDLALRRKLTDLQGKHV